MNLLTRKEDIDYSGVTVHIPWVMNTLGIKGAIEVVYLAEIRDAFRVQQMQSKAWLLSQVEQFDRTSKILVIGSWLGFTSYCLYKLGFTYISETDPESRFAVLANNINRENPNFQHFSQDVNNLDVSSYDLIINTSCEHIGNNTWFKNIKPDCQVVLHSTNMKWHDHVNTVENLEEMKSKYPMNLTYAGQLDFGGSSRFMLVGTAHEL